ncbi:CPBP family intramembrane glutamic endopeptidase [Botrimarina hoheduenensis]|uniref:CAAX amino terminal protease self-immunity n=1 Tax=Botrimarina hoheduenensis TaxID=2528000 RepID=A0A5C5WDL9_9BACT|nr:CPBP family intramembrane glutamic endopeptidase [Botrimarina hoheduenensis]TWT48730.1 CAAX amino terminal protease self- immunity [Botrimarina hoheduenensis]
MDPPAAESPALAAIVLLLFSMSLLLWAGVLVRGARGGSAIDWRRRRRVPWGPAAVGLPLLLTAMPLLTLASRGEVAPDPRPVDIADAATVTGAYLGFIFLAVLVVSSHQTTSRSDFGMPAVGERSLLRDALLGMAACLAALPLVYGVQGLVVNGLELDASHPMLEALAAASLTQKLSAAWLAVVVAPLMEEFAYRVLLQGWLERFARRTAWWPLITSAALFALAHQGQGYAPIALGVFGLVIGYVYRQTHRLMPCVAMHALFNGLSFGLALWMAG